MRIGVWELAVIFVIALVVIGPDKFPEFARRLGSGLRELKKATNEVTKEFRENVAEPLNEAGKPLKEALEPLQEAADEIRQVDRTLKKASSPGGLKNMARDAVLKPADQPEKKTPAQTAPDAAGPSEAEETPNPSGISEAAEPPIPSEISEAAEASSDCGKNE